MCLYIKDLNMKDKITRWKIWTSLQQTALLIKLLTRQGQEEIRTFVCSINVIVLLLNLMQRKAAIPEKKESHRLSMRKTKTLKVNRVVKCPESFISGKQKLKQ